MAGPVSRPPAAHRAGALEIRPSVGPVARGPGRKRPRGPEVVQDRKAAAEFHDLGKVRGRRARHSAPKATERQMAMPVVLIRARARPSHGCAVSPSKNSNRSTSITVSGSRTARNRLWGQRLVPPTVFRRYRSLGGAAQQTQRERVDVRVRGPFGSPTNQAMRLPRGMIMSTDTSAFGFASSGTHAFSVIAMCRVIKSMPTTSQPTYRGRHPTSARKPPSPRRTGA